MAADEAVGALEQPDADRDRDPDQDAGREHVLDQAQPVGAADQGQLEGRIDQLAHDLEDRGEQDQEPPEDQRVHQAGERALEQLALAEDLDAFTRDPARDVAAPLDRAAEPHERVSSLARLAARPPATTTSTARRPARTSIGGSVPRSAGLGTAGRPGKQVDVAEAEGDRGGARNDSRAVARSPVPMRSRFYIRSH